MTIGFLRTTCFGPCTLPCPVLVSTTTSAFPALMVHSSAAMSSTGSNHVSPGVRGSRPWMCEHLRGHWRCQRSWEATAGPSAHEGHPLSFLATSHSKCAASPPRLRVFPPVVQYLASPSQLHTHLSHLTSSATNSAVTCPHHPCARVASPPKHWTPHERETVLPESTSAKKCANNCRGGTVFPSTQAFCTVVGITTRAHCSLVRRPV